MKILLYEHKKLYNNTLIAFTTMFFLIIVLFIIPNGMTIGLDHKEFTKVNLFTFILLVALNLLIIVVEMFEFALYSQFFEFLGFFLLLVTLIAMFVLYIVYFIWLYQVILNKDKQIKYSKLVAFQIIYLLIIVTFFYFSLTILTSIILIPVFIFNLYNLIFTIKYKKKHLV